MVKKIPYGSVTFLQKHTQKKRYEGSDLHALLGQLIVSPACQLLGMFVFRDDDKTQQS